MKRFLISTVAGSLMLSGAVGVALGAPSHGGGSGGRSVSAPSMMVNPTFRSPPTNALRGPSHTGQPNQSCGSATAPETPGHAATAPGSAFNPSGTAGSVYAGQQPQNSRNTASVAQYDAACSHQP